MAGKHEQHVDIGWLKENFDLRGADVFWKVPNAWRRGLDTPAGYVAPHGYRMIKASAPDTGRVMLYAHRVAFALTHGHWPRGHIDHVDGNRANNAPENLRDVTYLENNKNRAKPKTNRSGVVGVRQLPTGAWLAYIGKRGGPKKQFSRFDDAVAYRRQLERDADYHENHGRVPA